MPQLPATFITSMSFDLLKLTFPVPRRVPCVLKFRVANPNFAVVQMGLGHILIISVTVVTVSLVNQV